MDIIEIIFVLTGIFGLLIYVYLVFNFSYWRKRGIDGPKPRPLYGNLPSCISQSRNTIYDLNDIYRSYKGKERFVGFFSMRTPQLLIIDPKLARDILITNFRCFHDNEMGLWIDKHIDPILGQNPFFMNGSEWKNKRSEITPALSANRMKASYPIMQEICCKLNEYLVNETKKSTDGGINVKELSDKYTTEIVTNCIYGIDAGAFTSASCKIREMGSKIMNQSFATFLYFLVVLAIPKLLKIYRRPFVQKEVSEFFTNVLNDAIKLREENKSDRVDFLNYLLQLKEKKNSSTLEIAAHTMTFFLDGFETSSGVITNCLHMLARHEEAQKLLRKEINAAFEENGEITFEQLHELPYLDQCINETLRICPPILTNNKICTEECEITTNKDKRIKIEKDTIIVLPYYLIHHDAEFYTNPEEFDPDRFSAQNGGVQKFKDLGVFLPFGDGPRICLGMKFGIFQIKAAIVEIIRNWEVTVNCKTKGDYKIDPKQFLCIPEGGTWLDFKKLNK